KPYTPLAGEPLQPLGQLSGKQPAPALRPCAVRKNTGSPPSRQTLRAASVLVAFVSGRRPGFIALDTLVDLLAVDRNFLGCGDANAHLVALGAEDGHGDRISNHPRLANAPGQNHHVGTLARGSARCGWTAGPSGEAVHEGSRKCAMIACRSPAMC